MTASTAELQARRRADLAAALKPQPRPSAWSPDEQARHRTALIHALDGTEWHQPIPARRPAAARYRAGHTTTPRKDQP